MVDSRFDVEAGPAPADCRVESGQWTCRCVLPVVSRAGQSLQGLSEVGRRLTRPLPARVEIVAVGDDDLPEPPADAIPAVPATVAQLDFERCNRS